MKRNIKAFVLIITVGLIALTSCGNSSNAQLKECLDLGQKYMTEMNYEEAIIAYNKALEIDPKNVEAYQVLANIYEFKGDIDQATGYNEMNELLRQYDIFSNRRCVLKGETGISGNNRIMPYDMLDT